MARIVTYKIFDRSDGRFDAVVLLGTSSLHQRAGFLTLAEAEEWIEGLRVLMAACGAPVIEWTGAASTEVARRSREALSRGRPARATAQSQPWQRRGPVPQTGTACRSDETACGGREKPR